MVETTELSALLERMEKTNKKQLRLARLQCLFTAIAAICCAAALVVILSLLPQINALLTQAETLVTQVETAMEQVDVVLEDVQTVTSQLSQADWTQVVSDLEQVADEIADANLGGLATEIAELVETAQTGVEDAIKKLDTIDLQTLNKGIEDLTAVIEPLAKFVNLF